MSRLSLGLLIALLFSLLSNICLAQNYTQSLITEANDGIGISNFVADIIIASESLSVALFKSYFENSIIVTVILILLFIFSLVVKRRDRTWSYGHNLR